MNIGRGFVAGLILVSSSLSVLAQSDDEHAQHHPGGTVPQKEVPQGMGSMMDDMSEHMKAMQTMHEKMAAASTPEQRKALEKEHLKLMKEGMAMMKEMGGMGDGMSGNVTDRQQRMEMRMGMMEKMMQMMMDRMDMMSK